MPVPREVRDAFRVLVPNRFELATLVGASREPADGDHSAGPGLATPAE